MGKEMILYLDVEMELLPISGSGRLETIMRSCSSVYGIFVLRRRWQKLLGLVLEYLTSSYSFIPYKL